MKNSKLKIGEQIKKFRIMRGMTQNDLAERIGLTEKQISKIETGVHYPMFENFVKILEVLNVEMKDFDCGMETETNSRRNSILKILYRASDSDLEYYAAIIRQVDKILKEKEKK